MIAREFATLAEAQRFVRAMDAALGYPNAETKTTTWAIPIAHPSGDGRHAVPWKAHRLASAEGRQRTVDGQTVRMRASDCVELDASWTPPVVTP